MKRQSTIAMQLVLTGMLVILFSSCFKDDCSHTYRLYKPIMGTLTQARANMKSNAPRALENPGKIYIYGNYIFVNENGTGIHVIDNSQPASPKNIAFIDIPGTADLAVKENTLYADSYSDLVAFDISNPKQVIAKKFLNNVFPHRNRFYYGNTSNPDSIKLIIGYTEKDTTVSCETYTQLYAEYYSLASADKSGNYSAPPTGMGGSMARFTLLNDYMYTVSNNSLSTFDLSVPQNPVFKEKKTIGGWNIETIFPFKDNLFIGSTTTMYIYNVSNPASPVQTSQFTHVRSCDPVIADDNNAYVTLRSGTTCGGNINRLEVLNITNLSSPSLLKTYPMTSPHGLSKDNNLLFICDGDDGLKVYDATEPSALKLVKQITGMKKTYDVIAWNSRALVVAQDGLYQFDYSNSSNIRLLSKIGVGK